MVARLRSWWKQIKQHRLTILVVTIILVVAVALILIGYRYDWTGFNGNNKSDKTLWDWMQLLFIPVVLAVAGFWFKQREKMKAGSCVYWLPMRIPSVRLSRSVYWSIAASFLLDMLP